MRDLILAVRTIWWDFVLCFSYDLLYYKNKVDNSAVDVIANNNETIVHRKFSYFSHKKLIKFLSFKTTKIWNNLTWVKNFSMQQPREALPSRGLLLFLQDARSLFCPWSVGVVNLFLSVKTSKPLSMVDAILVYFERYQSVTANTDLSTSLTPIYSSWLLSFLLDCHS